MSSFSSLGEPGVSRTVGRTSVMGRLPELQTLPILGLIMSTTRRTVILSIGWPAILIGLLVLLVAVTPAVEQTAGDNALAGGHAYCPLHTNPVIVAAVVALPTARVIHWRLLAGQPPHLPAVVTTVFVPPRG